MVIRWPGPSFQEIQRVFFFSFYVFMFIKKSTCSDGTSEMVVVNAIHCLANWKLANVCVSTNVSFNEFVG